MRIILAALALLIAMTGARAEPLFGVTAFKQWKVHQWTSPPLPVPKGWTFEQDETSIFSTKTQLFKGLPPGGRWDAKWIDAGVIVWRFHYGVRKEVSRDALHLSLLKATAAGAESMELLAWEELGGVRASLHSVSGSKGQKERSVILSFWGPGKSVNVMTAFAPEEGFSESGALDYAGTFFGTLTGQKDLAAKLATLEPREKTPAQSKPYAMAKETKLVEWAGRTVHVPSDWQVSFTPIDQGIAEGMSMAILASPNLADEDAPKMTYVRWSGEKGAALDFLKQLMESVKKQAENYTLERMSKIGEIACALASEAGEAVSLIRGYACMTKGDIEGTDVVEAFGFDAPADEFEALGGKKVPLLMTQEIEPDALGDTLTLALDPAKRLLTTREVPPFPALVPVGQHRVPAGWATELSFLDGELRFLGPEDGGVRPVLAYRSRVDTGTDAEVALTNLIEDYTITDFTLDNSDYLDGANGLIAVGTGNQNGKPIKIGAMAEKDDPSIYVFRASPEQFDAMGGAALLAPVFLKFPPDAFEGIAEPNERIAMIAKSEGERLVKERAELREMKIWQMKTETETIINAYRALSLATACGAYC